MPKFETGDWVRVVFEKNGKPWMVEYPRQLDENTIAYRIVQTTVIEPIGRIEKRRTDVVERDLVPADNLLDGDDRPAPENGFWDLLNRLCQIPVQEPNYRKAG